MNDDAVEADFPGLDRVPRSSPQWMLRKEKSFRAAARGRDRIARIVRDFHFGSSVAPSYTPRTLPSEANCFSRVASSNSGMLGIPGAMAMAIISIYDRSRGFLYRVTTQA